MPGLTNLTVTEEKGRARSALLPSAPRAPTCAVRFHRRWPGQAAVLDLRAETMSLEDVFLQLTEAPEAQQTPQQDHTKEGDEQ